MAINFGALAGRRDQDPVIHPRDIFNALPNKPHNMDYLRGPQDQVLEKWWGRRTARDLVIKMNTGGGKTIVGLLIAQSSLAEGVGPVVYLVPDHYLVDQVVGEADRLGIKVTKNLRDFDYSRGRTILVDVFQRLFNGLSVFGVGGSAGREASVAAPKTVIIDDVHACLNKAEQAFQLVIPREHGVYESLLNLFSESIEQQSPASYIDLKLGLHRAVQQIPYWSWIDKQRSVLEILHPVSNEEPHKFAWPLLVDVLPDCRAVFTGDSLEFAAPNLNSDLIAGFRAAERRIYLTATLADDGVLISDFGADVNQVTSPITPANAGDIGDRLILVPQQTHPNATHAEIRKIVLNISQNQNVAVIVPSKVKAASWASEATMVLDKSNLSDGVEAMRANPSSGLYIFINRYDGVDLPGDACHVLVIDGLPEALTGMERIDAAQLSGTGLLVAQQVQRLEQGMGRAVRSNDDHCVIFLLGERLAERLNTPLARKSFSPATRAQIELSEQVGDLIRGSATGTLMEVALQCLNRDPNWIAASRARLATLRYEPARVSNLSIDSRIAFERATEHDYSAALENIQRSVNESSDPILQSYIKQQFAAYQHHLDPVASQQVQKAANRTNRALLRPLEGVRYEKIATLAHAQGTSACAHLQSAYHTANDLIIGLNAIIADHVWGPHTQAFERAWADLALVLGFASQQPELETGRGPDGLWEVSGGRFHVIEAKSGAIDTHPVYKDDAKQLSNAMDWFAAEYTSVAKATPVLIHPRERFDTKAAVPIGCRVITTEKLQSLRDTLMGFSVELSQSDAFRDPQRVGKLLAFHRLTADMFLDAYSVPARPGK